MLDLRQIMDDGKILIVNLSKGRVGEDNAALLGAFFVNGIQQAAMSRDDIAEPDRRDFSHASLINESDVLSARFQRRATDRRLVGKRVITNRAIARSGFLKLCIS